MSIWYLIFWSIFVNPFEGGQYQNEQACKAAARKQAVHYREMGYIGLKWKCEVRISI